MATRPKAQQQTPAERREHGRGLRAAVPRSMQARWEPPTARRDPVLVLEEQESGRVPELLPIRHGRMMASPLAFLRGAAAVMAEDLAGTPVTGLRVQACGDAHLLNFGIFATPERRLDFDVNDFDETLPAPFEWDVKRLAASVVVAGRARGFSAAECEQAGRGAAASYRSQMGDCAAMSYLEVWYARLDVSELMASMRKAESRRLQTDVLAKARRATSLGALAKLTEVVEGRRRIIDAPPLVEHLEWPAGAPAPPLVVLRYRRSLPDDRRVLLDRYRVLDWARKVVGVGSVGTDDAIVLAQGDTDGDPLFLQVKEAQASVLEGFAGSSRYATHGQRVVWGQRIMQAASDIFLGWTSLGDRDYYVRQLRDMKGSIAVEKLSPRELLDYARACGGALGLAHARSGDAASIAAYLGGGENFDRAIADFAAAYADQTERDHAQLIRAARSGRIEAAPAA
jgi:uncharacterized protein (DUF2252 family)